MELPTPSASSGTNLTRENGGDGSVPSTTSHQPSDRDIPRGSSRMVASSASATPQQPLLLPPPTAAVRSRSKPATAPGTPPRTTRHSGTMRFAVIPCTLLAIAGWCLQVGHILSVHRNSSFLHEAVIAEGPTNKGKTARAIQGDRLRSPTLAQATPLANATSHNHTVPRGPSRSGTTDRYRTETRTFDLPANPDEAERVGTILRAYLSKDEAWYAVCDHDGAASWTKHHREHGGAVGKFFHRACPGPQHPMGIHADPFSTPSHNCSATARLALDIHSDHLWERWTLRALDHDGRAKSLGGDALYVVYSEYWYPPTGAEPDDNRDWLVPTAVGLPTDYYNGTYGLRFVSVPLATDYNQTASSTHWGIRKRGRLTVHAVTTCFIGELYPPLKDGWRNGGSTNTTWELEDVPRPYRLDDWYRDRYAPWLAWHRSQPTSKVRNDLSGFDAITIGGDSMLTQMVWNIFEKDYHPFARKLLAAGTLLPVPMTTDPTRDNKTSPTLLHTPLSPSTLETFRRAVDPWAKALADHPTAKHPALVLGSAAWDVIWPADWQGPHFATHLDTVVALLRDLRSRYPTVTLVWKLPYAQHMHNANQKICFAESPEVAEDHGSCLQALRYASRERFATLHRLQAERIRSEFASDPQVVLLDLYEVSFAAGAAWMIPGDAIHYKPEFNEAVGTHLLFAPE